MALCCWVSDIIFQLCVLSSVCCLMCFCFGDFWSTSLSLGVFDGLKIVAVVRLCCSWVVFLDDQPNSFNGCFESHQNLNLCLNPQYLASIVTRSSGDVRPPSLLLVELLVLVGPSTGTYPWKSTLLDIIVYFQPEGPAFSQKIRWMQWWAVSATRTLSTLLYWSTFVDDHTRDGNAWGAGIQYVVDVIDGGRDCP